MALQIHRFAYLQQLLVLMVACSVTLAIDSDEDGVYCPEKCQCPLPDVYCSRANFTDFPLGLDNSTTFLDLGHNVISAIEDDTFLNMGLIKLHVIVVDNNTITHVSRDAFRGLDYLRFLHLSGNRLKFLPRDLFKHNPAILHVDLTGNALLLPDNMPFLTAPSLEWLDLDHCFLTSLSNQTFEDVPKLRFLNLSNNSLRALSVTVLKKLTYMRYFKMSVNPFHCDCQLMPLWKWLQSQKIKTDATCAGPAEYVGKSWSVVEGMSCSE